jgi:hypothetical protein
LLADLAQVLARVLAVLDADTGRGADGRVGDLSCSSLATAERFDGGSNGR